MKKTFYILILFSFSRQFFGQTNLVPNWSFETYTVCPPSTVKSAFPWTAPYNDNADYYNGCSTVNFYNVPHYGGLTGPYSYFYLDAKEGQAYAGFFTFQYGYREYIQVKLNDTLKNNGCYYAEFYASNQQSGKYKTNNIGASLLSNGYPDNGSSGNLIPAAMHITNYGNPVLQDTAQWHKISGIYQATGNEKYILIGNFKDDSNTDTVNLYPPGTYPYILSPFSYIFVDAVSVYSINPNGALPWTYRDTTITSGDSVYIGNYVGGNFNPSWYTYSGSFIANNAGIYVKPTTTSQYIVQFTLCGVSRSDTVEVTVNSGIGIKELEISNSDLLVSPNPNNGLVSIEIQKKEFILQNCTIKICDVSNRQIKELKVRSKKQDIELHDIESGIYYLQLFQNGKILLTKKIVKQ